MSIAAQFTKAIKHALKANGRTYASLASQLGISESSVKRLLSRGGISLERLDAICAALELEVGDLVQLVARDVDHEHTLTLEQEEALAADAKLLVVLYMLLNGWTSERVAADCELSRAEVVHLLARLDRLRLIELLPGNRVRPRLSRDHVWRSNGPLRKQYRDEALLDFVSSSFPDPEEYLRFEIGLLGPSGVDQLKRRFDRLTQEFNELVTLDSRVTTHPTKPVAVVLAFRPWDFMWILTRKTDLMHPHSMTPSRQPRTRRAARSPR